eukprot:2388486-Amphidinium_carterae.2
MAGKRSAKYVIMAFGVCATCWMVAWTTRCFMQQRHFVSNPHTVNICRQTRSAQKNAKALPELPLGVDDFATIREANCSYVDKTGFLPGLVAFPRQHFRVAQDASGRHCCKTPSVAYSWTMARREIR